MLASFIIPTQNRATTLRQTLSSVHAIAKDQDVEVLVVDNASTDDTPQVCREESGKWRQGQFQYHFEPIPGLLSGRHRGAQESRGEILIYLDDDIVLQPDWFSGFLDVFSDPQVALAGGPSFPIYEIPPPDWLEGLWEDFDGGRHCGHLSLIDQGPKKKVCDPTNIWGLNFSIRRDALYACGGFHPDCVPARLQRFQGDGETGLAERIKLFCKKTMYHPSMTVGHLISKSRLQPEYFETRGFYQGVSYSFTQIRKSGVVKECPKKSVNIYFKLFNNIERKKILLQPTSKGIIKLVDNAIKKGFDYHQSEVALDPLLYNWVTKKDYFNYRLPLSI